MEEEQEQAKRAAEETFQKELARIEAEERQPNDWERNCFVDAFHAMEGGLYQLAQTRVEQSTQKPSPQANLAAKDIQGVDLAYLKSALRMAMDKPVKPRRDFGSTSLPKPRK